MKTEPLLRTLRFGQREVAYRLTQSTRKRLRISVRPDLSVSVSAPLNQNEGAIAAAVQAQAPWICRHLDELASFHPLPTPYRYVSGETFLYLGRQYRLKVEVAECRTAKLTGRFLHVRLPNPKDASEVREAINNWYRTRATEVFSKSFDRCLPVAVRHGATDAKIVIRRMQTRWGSCSRADRITLNLYLVRAPIHCIDYVVMHELCHLVEHNHSTAFYRLLTRCMPDWKTRRQLLRHVTVPK
ncbi:MAG: SprT family zinc-dependent metalloprotease [Opitutaceae bacterium]|jgi:hypothetical protein